MRVLYVEDDESVAKSVQLMLESEGHSCDSTGSGKRGVELAKPGKYDIILLDIMLPDIDGYEVIKRLRASGVRTPVLIQTGLVGDGIRHDGLSLGVSQYLVKPFNKSELIERIEGVASGAPRRLVPDPDVEPVPEDSLQDTAQDAADERRQHRRFETTLPAKILYNEGIDCIILNMSYGGAAIELPSADTNCPPVFDLQIAFGTKFRCRVCWRFQNKIGVKGDAGWAEGLLSAQSKHLAPATAAPEQRAPDMASSGVVPPSRFGRAAPPPAESPQEPPAARVSPRSPALPPREDSPDAEPEDEPAPAEAAAPELAPAAAEAVEPEAVRTPVEVAEPEVEPAPAEAVASQVEPAPAEAAEPAPSAAAEQMPVPPPAPVEHRTVAPETTPPADEAESDQQAFVVDAGVRLVAETLECSELLVKGHLEASVRAARLWVAPGGQVIGSAEVDSADVAGRFEGTLSVAGRLVIDAAGSVSGRTRYDEIVIEPGGQIAGEIQSTAANGAAGPVHEPRQRPVAPRLGAVGR